MNLFAILAHFSKSPNLRRYGTVVFRPPFTPYKRNYSDLKPLQRLQPQLLSTEKMSDASSEEFSDLTFTFSEEDLARIDISIEASFQQLDQRVGDAPFPTGIGGLNTASSPEEEGLTELDPIPSQTSTVPADNVDEPTANSSFASDTFELNIGTLSAEDLELIDTATSENRQPTNGKDGPAIEIELEFASSGSGSDLPQKSPLEQFRSHLPLSVIDLCSPSWCEVQYDYGLRGKRSRPLARRPKSFVSSLGKKISPVVQVAQKNDVTTKQGRAIHKELEREIKLEELKVDITTDETRWALRLVNMIACLRGIMTGFTREMPVFGIVHDEVVVGIMDEVVKFEIPSLSNRSPKRPLNPSQSATQAKRAKKDKDRRFQSIDRFFQSPKKADALIPDDPTSITAAAAPRTAHTLYIKDSKTRERDCLPSDDDTYSGRIQLMIYRRLLSELVSTNPPYDFKRLWDKLGVNSTEVFPTRFLVQARLIEESEQFKTACLDDLVESWNKLVKEFDIVGVDPQLELIYRLQPPRSEKGKDKAGGGQQSDESSVEGGGLAKALAASLRDVDGGEQTPVAGPSNLKETKSVTAKEVVETVQVQGDMTTSKNSSDEMFNSEDVQLQWAIQQSILPQANGPDISNPPDGPSANPIPLSPVATRKGKAKATGKKETGIRRFKIIGTKSFIHDDLELDNYLTQVLHWWRGERKPEGVSLEHSYRCRTCEYAEDCEWRAQKALEFSNRRKKT